MKTAIVLVIVLIMLESSIARKPRRRGPKGKYMHATYISYTQYIIYLRLR